MKMITWYLENWRQNCVYENFLSFHSAKKSCSLQTNLMFLTSLDISFTVTATLQEGSIQHQYRPRIYYVS